jgi:hypothetical protein
VSDPHPNITLVRDNLRGNFIAEGANNAGADASAYMLGVLAEAVACVGEDVCRQLQILGERIEAAVEELTDDA